MNWYIGQKIVAVRDHSEGFFKIGQEFRIRSIKESICKCKKTLIDIGMDAGDEYDGASTNCRICKSVCCVSFGEMFFNERCFAPIEPAHELSTHTTETLIEELEEQLQTA